LPGAKSEVALAARSHKTLQESLGAIEIVPRVIAPQIASLECQGPLSIVSLEVHTFAVGVSRGGRQAARETPFEFHGTILPPGSTPHPPHVADSRRNRRIDG
jgi:hypothetical protein